jgi:hypothetical protein
MYVIKIDIIIIIILPLALQPAVGFGLLNKILLFPICYQLSPSSLNLIKIGIILRIFYPLRPMTKKCCNKKVVAHSII